MTGLRGKVINSVRSRAPVIVVIAAYILGCGGGGDSTGPSAGTKLAFTVQPAQSAAGSAISPTVQVEIQNADGTRATNASSSVAIALSSAVPTATLLGTRTVKAVAGVATFPDLAVDVRGSGFTLVATAAGLQQATSDPFSTFLKFDAVTAGVAHACAIAAGRAYCMGTNSSGHVGDGTTTPRLSPTLTSLNEALVSIDAGVSHNCALT